MFNKMVLKYKKIVRVFFCQHYNLLKWHVSKITTYYESKHCSIYTLLRELLNSFQIITYIQLRA